MFHDLKATLSLRCYFINQCIHIEIFLEFVVSRFFPPHILITEPWKKLKKHAEK